MEAVDNYIYILNVRFAGDIHFSKKVECDVGNVRVPSMILQPVVENAVNHGIRNIDWEGHINLSVERWDDHIEISVRDNGLGMTQEQCQTILQKDRSDSKGIGVKNVNDRLKIYFGEEYGITIESELDVGTTVTIKIPKIEKGQENEY